MNLNSLFLNKLFLLLFLMPFWFVCSVNAQTYCNVTSQVTYDFGLSTSAFDRPYGMLEQPDGKLVVFGTSYFSSANSFRVSMMRLNADLTLDTLFGNGGKVVKTWSQRNIGVVGALQNDGKILIGGSQAPSNASSQIKPFVGRFNSDGSVDTLFGVLGSVKIDTFARASVIGIKELANGKVRVVMIKSNPAGFVMLQLNADGSADTTFANNGSIFHPFPTAQWQTYMDGVLFTSDTSTIVIWTAVTPPTYAKTPMVIKFSSDGDIDSSFAQNGVLDINQSIATSSGNYRGVRSVLTPNEDIIIGASTGASTSRKMFLYKINGQTGIIDSTGFGTNGKILSSQSILYNEIKNMDIDPSNGDIYAVGTSGSSGQRAATWRVSSSGVEINQCGGNPIKEFTLGNNYTSVFYAAKFICNGKLRLVGNSGVLDTLISYTNQSLNYMIPYDTMPNPITFVSDTACDSYLSPSGNFTWTVSGTYLDTMTSVLGCDSLLSIDLIIKNSTSATIAPTVCNSYTSPSSIYNWLASGTYMDTIPNAVGCDSVITINLTVNYSTSAVISVTTCDSYSSPSGNYNWIVSGVYMDTIPNAVGCDSMITVNLTVNYSTTSTLNVTVCNSYTSPSGIYTWINSGTFTDTIPNAMGCDSVIIINLTINTPTTATFDVTACGHYVSPNGIDIWLTSGTYTATLQNAAGCDSIITLNLIINNVDTGVIVNGFVLSSNAIGAQYQWLDCANNYAKINGAVTQTYVPISNGMYAVEVTQNGCIDTTSCFTVVGVGINEQSVFTDVSFYPNPTNGLLNFEFGNLKGVEVKIYDLNGRLIFSEVDINKTTYQVNINAAPGMYVIELRSEEAIKTYKLLVK